MIRILISCSLSVSLSTGGVRPEIRPIRRGNLESDFCAWKVPFSEVYMVKFSLYSKPVQVNSTLYHHGKLLDWWWTKYQIKLFTISQLLNLHHVAGYKKLPACKTAKTLTAYMILRKKTITNIFNHVKTDWLIIFLLNTVIGKKN